MKETTIKNIIGGFMIAMALRGFVFMLVIAVILYSLLISCTPKGNFSRLIQNYPELIKEDSTIKTTLVIHNHPPADTSLNKVWFLDQLSKMKVGDTTIIHNHNIIQKFYTNSDGSIGEKILTPPDTSVNREVDKNKFVEVTEKKKSDFQEIKEIIILILVALGIIELLRFFKK